MSSQLSRDEVRRIAALAHLDLTESDVEAFSHQLTAILEFADAIRNVDTSGIAPTSHPLETRTAWRDDVPSAGLERDVVLDEAPDADREQGVFRVPKVL